MAFKEMLLDYRKVSVKSTFLGHKLKNIVCILSKNRHLSKKVKIIIVLSIQDKEGNTIDLSGGLTIVPVRDKTNSGSFSGLCISGKSINGP